MRDSSTDSQTVPFPGLQSVISVPTSSDNDLSDVVSRWKGAVELYAIPKQHQLTLLSQMLLSACFQDLNHRRHFLAIHLSSMSLISKS